MRTYQNIEAKILDLTEKTKEFAFMNRDQIFETIAQIVALGDELARFIRDIDMTIARKMIGCFGYGRGFAISYRNYC